MRYVLFTCLLSSVPFLFINNVDNLEGKVCFCFVFFHGRTLKDAAGNLIFLGFRELMHGSFLFNFLYWVFHLICLWFWDRSNAIKGVAYGLFTQTLISSSSGIKVGILLVVMVNIL